MDVTDLAWYLTSHTSLSGIQRVLSEVFMYLANESEHAVTSVIFRSGQGDFVEVSSFKLNELLEVVKGDVKTSEKAHGENVKKLAAELLHSNADRPSYTPSSDQVFLSLGATWIHDGYFKELQFFKTLGTRVVCLVYDLIPIRDAVFPKDAASRFEEYIHNIANVADFAPAISKYVRNDFEDYVQDLGLRLPKGSGHRLPGGFNNKLRVVNPIWEKPYVICVGSIEKRKNHLLLMRAWKRVILELGEANVPDLLIVGRLGWHAERFLEKMRITDGLNGKIHILSDSVSDDMLHHLFSGALFSVFPSLEEGWGLPVTESLNLGVPVIASNSSSIPEAGGDFAEYFDPHDIDSLTAILSEWIKSPSIVAERKRIILEQYQAYTWEMLTNSLLKEALSDYHVEHCIPTISVAVEYCLAPVSVYHGSENAGVFIDFLDNSRRMQLSNGIHNVEYRSKALLCIKNRRLEYSSDGAYIKFSENESLLQLQFKLDQLGEFSLILFIPSITEKRLLSARGSEESKFEFFECVNGVVSIPVVSKEDSPITVDLKIPGNNVSLFSFMAVKKSHNLEILTKLRNPFHPLTIQYGSGLMHNQALSVQNQLRASLTHEITTAINADFHNSFSWKLTSPLRLIHRLFIRMLRRKTKRLN